MADDSELVKQLQNKSTNFDYRQYDTTRCDLKYCFPRS